MLLGGTVIASRYVYIYPCARPILYKIGSVDPKFGVKEDQLKQNLKSAENIWEKPFGKNIFDYDPQGALTVNFVYDTRQALKTEIDRQEKSLTSQNQSLDAQIADYERQVTQFKIKNNELNTDINYWNSQGGAPQEEYDKLIARQKQLQQEADSLNQLAKSLNQTAQNYNSGVVKINNTIGTFNQALAIKPEEGLYTSDTNTIDIFFITDTSELIHTLAHELGHARGLDHENNPQAIMYPQSSVVTSAASGDIQAVESICSRRSFWDQVAKFIQFSIQSFSDQRYRLQSQG